MAQEFHSLLRDAYRDSTFNQFQLLALTLLIVSGLGAGCMPIYQRIRPSLDIQVQDPEGKPVPQTKLKLTTVRFPYGRTWREEIYSGDVDGSIETPSERRWALMLFTIHGSWSYAWKWCIEAPGFQTQDGRISSDDRWEFSLKKEELDASSKVPILLSKSTTVEKCGERRESDK